MSDNVSVTPVAASAPVEGINELNQAPVPPISSEEPPVEPQKPDQFAPKFAALTRKEKQVRDMEKAAKETQTKAEKLIADYEARMKALESGDSELVTSLKKNPLRTLKDKLGYDFDKLAEMQLNDQNPTPQTMIEQVRAELEEKYESRLKQLEEKIENDKKSAQQQAEEKAVEGYKMQLAEFLQNNADTYELSVAYDGLDRMFEKAEKHYKETGEVLSNEDLAKAVEEEFEAQIANVAKLKKFQQKFQPAKTEPVKPQTAPTLSNTLAAQVPKDGQKLLSDEESKRAVAKMLKWDE